MQSGNDYPNCVSAPRRQIRRIRPLRATLALLSLLLVLFSLGAWMVTSHQKASAATVTPAMGVNLAWSGDSNGDFLFADAMKTYRLEPAPGQSSAPSVDANGWPQGDFTAFLWDGAFLPHTTGTYALRFNGKATISVGLVSSTITNQSYDAGTNTTTATITINGDSSANLSFTNTQRTASSATNTGVTNVQFMRPTSPGASTSYSFNTTFTDAIKNFVKRFVAIRFMDTTSANGNTETNWSDRALPQGSQEGKASWEYVIQLCNETGKDGYINVPERATDDYITNLAKLFKYGSDANGNVYSSPQSSPVHAPLNSTSHLYIEFSNEVWNGSFQQMHDNHDSAVAEVTAGGSPLNYDGDTNEWDWAWRRTAKRIHDISVIFRSVFGDGAMPMTGNAQIRPILEWQYGNAQDTAHQGLSFLDNYYNNADGQQHVSSPHPVTYFLYGGGGAAYSSVKDPGASTIDGMYNSGLDTSVVGGTVVQDVQWAHQYGLHDIAYEGGFQIGGDGLSSLQKQANLDPRATNMEIQAQTTFTQSGGDLLMYFDSSSGNYGLAQPTVLDSTPKLQAIDQMNQNGVTYTPTVGVTPTPTPAPQQANIAGASSAPTIDGNSNDSIWGSASSYPLTHVVGSPSGFSASYQSAWDSNNLYFLVKVGDSTFSSHTDMVEIYLDPTHNGGTSYDSLDMQYQFSSNSTTVVQWNNGTQGTNTAGIVYANATVSGGYQVEIKIPWSTLKVTASSGKVIGLDMDVQQDTAGTGKNKLFWNATSDNDWTNPSLFGAGTLQAAGSSTPTPTPTSTSTPTPTPTSTPTGSLLAYEPFSGAAGALNGQNTGTGWSGGWSTQNSDSSVPGYDVSSGGTAPSYSTLKTSGNYATGGASYQTTGRGLNVSSTGPFSNYLSNGQIGKAGTTLWVSALLRKDANTDQEVSLTLHNNSIAWCTGCANQTISLGYFGSSSNNNGTRYWSLKLNGGTVARANTSNGAITVGQTYLLVARIDFGSTTTVSLFVNPTSLAGSAPSSPDVQTSLASALSFQSLAYYGGDGTNQSSLDELRFGTSYSAVTPIN